MSCILLCFSIAQQCSTIVSEVSHQLTKHKFPPEKWPYLAVGLRLAELVPTIEAERRNLFDQLQSLITHWVHGSRDQEQQHYWEKLINAVLFSEETVIAKQLVAHVGVAIHDGKHMRAIVGSWVTTPTEIKYSLFVCLLQEQ